MENEPLLNSLRALLGQDASIPALRAGLFLFGVTAAMAWSRRLPRLALLLVSAAGILGLSCWLIQISSPLGLGTDAALTRQWAQAGVNAAAEPKGPGFVRGTASENTLIGALASAGVPARLVFLVPQISALLGLVFLMFFPRTLIKDPTTAAFATCLVAGGGLWPGISPYRSFLLQPSLVVALSAAGGVALVAARQREFRRVFNRSRIGVALGLMAVAVLHRALRGGMEPSAVAVLLLACATILFTSPLRAVLRRASPSPCVARRLEAFLLLAAFGGSGLFWWDPAKTVPGFVEARDGGAALQKPLGWIAQNVPAGDVILASPAYSAHIAALAGRRVLFPPPAEGGASVSLPEPFRRARLAESILRGRPIARLAEAFSVTHLFLGPGEATPIAGTETDAADEPRLSLVLVYQDIKDFRVFRLAKK